MTGLVPIFAAKPEGTATVEIDVDIAYYSEADIAMFDRLATPGVTYINTCEEEDVD